MSDRKRILVVDDMQANIKILNDVLRSRYNISVATNGSDAIQLASSEHQPDLILLDIMMPEMDGYEVCKKLKSDENTKNIPILFVTAKTEVGDEAYGLSLGAVDYITKPFEPAVIKARIRTHLELESAKMTQQQLLNKTLSGSVRVIIEILSLFNPDLFSRSNRLRTLIKQLVEFMDLENVWEFELAAMLMNLGYISFPADLVSKLTLDEPLIDEEKTILQNHPKIGAKIIGKIPSLENISEMILNQEIPFYKFRSLNQDLYNNSALLGGHLLRLLSDFDKLTADELPPKTAITQMQEMKGVYSPDILLALKEVLKINEEGSDVRLLKLHELCEGMILDENIYSTSRKKLLLVRKGTELSDSILMRLRTLEKIAVFARPIRVRILKKEETKNV